MKSRMACAVFWGSLLATTAVAQAPRAKPTPTARQIVSAFNKALCVGQPLETPRSFSITLTLEESVTADGPEQKSKAEYTMLSKGNKWLTIYPEDMGAGTRNGFDGKVYWKEDQSGIHKVKPDDADTTSELNGLFLKSLVIEAGDYSLMKLRGTENVGGRPAFVVRMKPKRGFALVRYFDCKTLLLLREDDETKGGVGKQWLYGDYRPVCGLLMPFQMTLSLKGVSGGIQSLSFTTRITKFKVNIPIADSVFAYRPTKRPPHAGD